MRKTAAAKKGERANALVRQEVEGRMEQAAERRVAMARGTVVLDENVQQLEAALRGVNIRVVRPPAGMPDAQIRSLLLPNRIIVTRNARDFVTHASSYDYGVISLDNLRFIDPSPDPAENKTVQLISEAIRGAGLWSLRHGFVVTLQDDGRYTMTPLTD